MNHRRRRRVDTRHFALEVLLNGEVEVALVGGKGNNILSGRC